MGRDGRYWEHSFSDGDDARFRQRTQSRPACGYEEEGGEPCALGNRCYERDYAGNAKRGPRAFCPSDERWVERAIGSLPEDYARLSLLLAKAGQQEERVSGSRDAGLPLAADIDAFMRQIVHVALSWEVHVRGTGRLSAIPADPRRQGVVLAEACKTLARQFTVLLSLGPREVRRHVTRARIAELATEMEQAEAGGIELPEPLIEWDASLDAWETVTMDGTQAAMELLGLHGKARGMLGLSPQRRRITEVRCDGCGAKATLIQREGPDGGWLPMVSCTACPNAYTGARYDLLMGRVYQVQIEALEAEERRRRGALMAAG